MLLVIDAYNLIKQILGVSRVSEERRNECINELVAYARRKGHDLVLVFDGGSSGYPWREIIAHATVIYSGYRETADDVIKDFLVRNKARNPVLISSDRELRNYAAQLGQTSVAVHEFSQSIHLNQLCKPESSLVHAAHGQLHKTVEKSDPGLDELMAQASRLTVIKPGDYQAQKLQCAANKKTGKQERHKERLRKKL
jgi:predicted RNA-binding protein with PIN domain